MQRKQGVITTAVLENHPMEEAGKNRLKDAILNIPYRAAEP